MRFSRAPVAQLDRASDYESEGRKFESSGAHHLFLLFLNIFRRPLWRVGVISGPDCISIDNICKLAWALDVDVGELPGP